MVRRRTVVFAVLALLSALAVAAGQAPRFESEIRAFEARDRENPPKEGAVLFVGSSSIRIWTSLAKDLPRFDVLNRGFGGSHVADSVRVVDRIVTPYKPRAIVLYAGTNDLADGKSPETVAMDYRNFVEAVRAKLPAVPIAFISISPAPSRWKNIGNVRKANALVRAYSEATPGLRYIDTYPAMTNAIGGPRVELYGPDNLHMNRKGYELWTGIVEPALAEMTHPDR